MEEKTNLPDHENSVVSLREYIEVLRKWWWLIIGTTFITAAVAFVLSARIPVQYEASSILIDYSDLSVSVITPLAKSSPVMQAVFSALDPKPVGIDSYDTFLKKKLVSTHTASRNITLTARGYTANDAARIVNTWASVLAKTVGEKDHAEKERKITALQAQITKANAALTKTEADLDAYQGKNQIASLTNKLNSVKRTQADYLAQQRSLKLILKDTDLLNKQLSRRRMGNASTSDDLAVLSLFIRAMKGNSAYQAQVANKTPLFSGDSMEERIKFLEHMHQDIQDSLKALDDDIAALSTQILSLQKEIQVEQNTQEKLTQAKKLAFTNHNNMVAEENKLENAMKTTGHVVIVGQTEPPLMPIRSRHRFVNAELAAVLGLLLGAGLAFVIEWW